MCRLVLMNRAGAAYADRKVSLEYFFQYLEISYGGHGNGVAVMKNGRVKIKKGIDFYPEDAAEFLRKNDFDWAVFHTRLASVGSISHANTHPFRSGKLVLAMNGTELGMNPLADALGKTDTESIAILISKLRLPIETLLNFGSVFVGFNNGVPFAVKRDKHDDLEMIYDEKTEAVIFASEFPEEISHVYELPKDFIWKEGDELPLSNKKPNLPFGYRIKGGGSTCAVKTNQ